MDALFGMLLHPCRIVGQFVERSLKFSVFTYFIRNMRGSCAMLILCRPSAVIFELNIQTSAITHSLSRLPYSCA